MKQWLAAMAVMAWGLVDAGLADTNELARPRQWTSISGAQILAIFVQVSGDKVELRNRAGERIQIPRAKLSAADQALLDEAFGASAPPAAEEFGAAPAPPNPPLLPRRRLRRPLRPLRPPPARSSWAAPKSRLAKTPPSACRSIRTRSRN